MPNRPNTGNVRRVAREGYANIRTLANDLLQAVDDAENNTDDALDELDTEIRAWELEIASLMRQAINDPGTTDEEFEVLESDADFLDDARAEAEEASRSGNMSKLRRVRDGIRSRFGRHTPAPADVAADDNEGEEPAAATPAPVAPAAVAYGQRGWRPLWWVDDMATPHGDTPWQRDVNAGLTGHDHLLEDHHSMLNQIIAYLGGHRDDEGNLIFTGPAAGRRDTLLAIGIASGVGGLVFLITLLVTGVHHTEFTMMLSWSVMLGIGCAILIGLPLGAAVAYALNRRRNHNQPDTDD